MEIRGITISVNYAKTLEITLVRNMRHFSECLVVTSREDHATIELCHTVPSVRVFVTDAFTRHDAHFNKGLAMEEGLDALGRHGWVCIHDADILLPDEIPLDKLRADCLHGCKRRLLDPINKWTPDVDFVRCPMLRDGGPIGFFQLFHADAPSLKDKRYWYDPTFAHAGGGDAYFLSLFPAPKRVMLPMDVLHIGPCNENWFGVDPASKQIMDAFVIRNGWTRSRKNLDRTADKRVGTIKERVDVPGLGITDFELPFVRRAQQTARR